MRRAKTSQRVPGCIVEAVSTEEKGALVLRNVARFAIRATIALGLLLIVASVALAADAVPTVEVSGSVLDTDGQPAVVESARVEERETPDSEAVVTPIDVAEDGTFTVALREWGTPEAPAVATFFVFGPESEPVVVNEEGCTETTTPFGTIDVAIPGQVPTEPIVVVLDRELENGLCPAVTATPEPEQHAPQEQPAVTLPPTHSVGDGGPALLGSWAVVLVLGGVGLLGLATLLVRRSRAR
jgi:hypothetical protein